MAPVVNPRSVLHALEPLGLGTGEVESLLSYLCRLAVSHSTSTLSLSRAVAQHFEHDVEEQFDWFHRHLSGIGDSALTWSSALSAMTSLPRLDRLTFLHWKDVIAQNGLPIVSKGQFCPQCFADDRNNGKTPYFRLAWESKSVSVCNVHRCRLTQHCPSCSKDNVRHAASLVVPGWCTKCGAFLGCEAQNHAMQPAIKPVELWQARQISDLLQAQGQLQGMPKRQVLIDSISHIIGTMDGGKCAHFAKRLGISKSTIHYWLQTDNTPTLEASLRVASQSGIGLAKLLSGDLLSWSAPSEGQQLALALFKPEVRQRAPRREIDWNEVELQLQKSLSLPTPISVREISRRLCIEPRQLYLNFNQTTRQIGERWKTYLKRRRDANLEEAMPHLESAGRSVLSAGKSLNLREVTAHVPSQVLSGVHGLFGVLRDIRAHVEMN
ncbi:MAG: hypothetical protein EOO23_00790 [Comamonadaceae bacterium]|nr:MAG: hypothetical protein EOO23_00790 [Comamonadaceae bacterium]